MAPRKKTQKQQAEELISAAYPTKRTKKNLKKSRDFAKSYRKATTVPLKLTLAWSDADEAYQKGKNTSRESALLKRLLAAKKAVQNAQKKINKSTGQNARPSTAGQRREASRLFGRQEQTVEHEGRLGRIPGSVVGPNERFKRVTKEDKQKAADVTGLGLEIASYGIGAGQMIGLITGAAKFLTGAAAKLFAKKGGEKNLSQAMIKKANNDNSHKLLNLLLKLHLLKFRTYKPLRLKSQQIDDNSHKLLNLLLKLHLLKLLFKRQYNLEKIF